jgi:hypothetical protein
MCKNGEEREKEEVWFAFRTANHTHTPLERGKEGKNRREVMFEGGKGDWKLSGGG